MRTLPHEVVIAAMVSMAVAGWAGEDGGDSSALRLAVDLSDGSRVIGVPAVTSVPISTAVGPLALPLSQVATIAFRDDNEGVAVELVNGDRLSGTHGLGDLRLTALFGEVAINARSIRKISSIGSRAGPFREGLVLWNQLGSDDEVKQSRVGPGGTREKGRFVPGRFGQALELKMDEPFGVTFPVGVVPKEAGCIEFWARLVDFPQDLPWGEKPGLICIRDANSYLGPLLHFNGNDGVSGGTANGGLCARVGGIGSAGTAQHGTWTYTRALGGGDATAWHHYALVWSKAVLPGVGDGARRMAVFVDGQLNTGSWRGECPDPQGLLLPESGHVGFLTPRGMTAGSVIFDNLKIWNYARTDFSDRSDE